MIFTVDCLKTIDKAIELTYLRAKLRRGVQGHTQTVSRLGIRKLRIESPHSVASASIFYNWERDLITA